MMTKIISVLFVVFLANLILAHPGDFDMEKMEKMMKIVTNCQATTGASPEDVKMMMSKKEPETHEGKCMFNCILEGIEIVSIL